MSLKLFYAYSNHTTFLRCLRTLTIICLQIYTSDNRVQIASSFIIRLMGNETEKVVHVTTNTWDTNVLKSETPVLVDFWAEWCGPCRMVGPAVEQLSKTMDEK